MTATGMVVLHKPVQGDLLRAALIALLQRAITTPCVR